MSRMTRRGERPEIRKELLLTKTLADSLEETAEKTGTPGNELIRRALREYLETDTSKKPERVPVRGFLQRGDDAEQNILFTPLSGVEFRPPFVVNPGTYALWVIDDVLEQFPPIDAAQWSYIFLDSSITPPPGSVCHVTRHPNTERHTCYLKRLLSIDHEGNATLDGMALKAGEYLIRGVYVTKFENENEWQY